MPVRSLEYSKCTLGWVCLGGFLKENHLVLRGLFDDKRFPLEYTQKSAAFNEMFTYSQPSLEYFKKGKLGRGKSSKNLSLFKGIIVLHTGQ